MERFWYWYGIAVTAFCFLNLLVSLNMRRWGNSILWLVLTIANVWLDRDAGRY